jgi:hypothetical protein
LKQLLCFSLTIIALHLTAQDVLEIKLDSSSSRLSFIQILQDLESKHPIKFYYLNEWFENIPNLTVLPETSLKDFLFKALDGREINFEAMHGYAIYFFKDPTRSIALNTILSNAKHAEKKIDEITLGSKSKIDELVMIKGVIINGKTNEVLPGATIQVKDIETGAVTNALGVFELTLPGGQHILEISSINFEPRVINLFAYQSGELNLELEELAKLLEDIVVSDQAIHNPKSSTGLYKISIADIKKMPSFMGEVDIVKQVQILPGVTSVGEVSSGFNVRGGAADQNLVLFDGLPIFNYSHVFGFFSAFNAEAIKSASFHKGGIPSEFGGRISSVLNISGKEADYKKWQGGAGIGLITSSLSAGGPIVKDKSSVMVSVRSSYSDWMLKTFARRYNQIQNSSVSFYDVTAKLTQKIGTKDKLSLSIYSSKDNFGLPNDTTFNWQNNLGSLRYDHIIDERKSFSLMAGIGQYGYDVKDSEPANAYNLKYKITYPVLNFDMSIQLPTHKILFGSNTTLYNLSPGNIVPTSPVSNIKEVNIAKNQAFEGSLFVNDGIDINDKLHIDLGLRFTTFYNLGPGNVYTYMKDSALRNDTRVDTIQYRKGKNIQQYSGLEPRLSIVYLLNPEASIKLGYNRIFQYIHLISNSVAVTPIDIWQVSNRYIKPQIGNQLSLGYYQSLQDRNYEISAEAFVKAVNNVLDFKDGANLVLNPAVETAVIPSLGRSYGIEFSASKTKNAFVYSLNYTYSRSLRKTVNKHPEETINDGKYYPSNYDQPHVINANWKFAPSRRFAITGNFNYHTGRATTVPVSYNIIDHVPIVNYSSRNGYRVPDYHRMDLAFVLEGDHRKKKLWQGTWTLSFYNVYARRNVYTVFYSPNKEGIQAAYRMAIIGSIIPSLSYRIKF